MKKSVAIVGGGTAGLFLAAFLDADLFKVTIYEKKGSFARKFLVAGDGGFNLSHSEDMADFRMRYSPTDFLTEALNHFTNTDLRNWLKAIGIPTFIGSSKRIYPEKGIKPITVLKAILGYLEKKEVHFQFNKTFTGWNSQNDLVFNSDEVISADFNVLALGGSSWEITGSDGSWINHFSKKGIETVPFQAENCAFQVQWDHAFSAKNAGLPLKNISVSIANSQQKGELVITKFGLEGNAIYALSPDIQHFLRTESSATVFIDFKPTLSEEVLLSKLLASKQKTTQTLKEVIKLNSTQIQLIKNHLPKEDFLDESALMNCIKHFPITITGSAALNEAISTSGGIPRDSLTEDFELIKLQNNYCIGEMVNWNAPTGGYLIQGCASMGALLAHKLKLTVHS